MRKYTVREISRLLKTNEETVRRWIRDKKLASHMESRKEGNVVYESDLMEFIDKYPKYRARMHDSSYEDAASAFEYAKTQVRKELKRLYTEREELNKRIARLEELLK